MKTTRAREEKVLLAERRLGVYRSGNLAPTCWACRDTGIHFPRVAVSEDSDVLGEGEPCDCRDDDEDEGNEVTT